MGNQVQKIQTSGQYEGYHTITHNEDLVYIYTDKINIVINRIIANNIVTAFIKTKRLESTPPTSTDTYWWGC